MDCQWLQSDLKSGGRGSVGVIQSLINGYTFQDIPVSNAVRIMLSDCINFKATMIYIVKRGNLGTGVIWVIGYVIH